MNSTIPTSVAVQGASVVAEYIKLKQDIDRYKNECRRIAKEIKENEHKIKTIFLNSTYSASISLYYKDIGVGKLYENALAIEELAKENVKLSLDFKVNDHKQLSLRQKLFEKGWMADWQRDEWIRFDYKS